MKLDLHIFIHGQFIGVLDDPNKLQRWLNAIKRTQGTFHTSHMVQFPKGV